MAETKTFSVVNHKVPRLESMQKATGEILYTDDIRMPGEAAAMLIRSPYPRARVLSIDTSEAEKVPGYLGCVTPYEAVQKKFNCSGNPPSGLLFQDEYVLTTDCKSYGDRIMILAAETLSACREAVQAVKIEYEVLKPYLTIKEALAPDAEPLQPDISDTNVAQHRDVEKGTAKEGEAHSEALVEGHYSTQPMQHAQIELTSCLVDFSDGRHLKVYSNSQTIYQERRILAELLDMRESDIDFIKPAVGAGFGARQQLHSQPAAALMSRKIHRPVRLCYSREEDIATAVARHGAEIDIRVGADRDGKLQYFETKYQLNTGAYTTHGPTVCAAAARKFQYNVPNYLFHGDTVFTDHVTAGAFRGYGNTQLTFGREIAMDELAQKLGMDPVEFRLKNHIHAGEYFPCASMPVNSCAIEDCVRRAKKFQAHVDEVEGPLVDNEEKRQAWGYAFACHGSGASNLDGLSSAIVMMNDDGTVQLLVGSCDIGQGSETMEAQICAESLGIDLADVHIYAADTRFTPYDTGTFGSSQAFLCGNAIVNACRDFKAKYLAALQVVYPDKVPEVLPGNRFSVKKDGVEEIITYKEGARKIMFDPHGTVIIGSGAYKALASPNPFVVCFVKAEYYKKLNAIRILDIIQVADVGTPINRLTLEGQLQGGILQGMGYALFEHIEINPKLKKPMSTDFLHYRFAEADDMPNLYVDMADSYEPTGPHGAKSVGELCTIPSGPAIVNAVAHACGKPVHSIPLSDHFIILPSRRREEQ